MVRPYSTVGMLVLLGAVGCQRSAAPAPAASSAPSVNATSSGGTTGADLVLPWGDVGIQAPAGAKVSWVGHSDGEAWQQNGMAIVNAADGEVWINRHEAKPWDDAWRAMEESSNDDGGCKLLSSTKDRRTVSCTDAKEDIFIVSQFRTVGAFAYECFYRDARLPGDAAKSKAERDRGTSLAERICSSLTPKDGPAASTKPSPEKECGKVLATLHEDSMIPDGLTPECAWRAEDARDSSRSARLEKAKAKVTPIPEMTKPGYLVSLNGRLPPEVLKPQLKTQDKALAACLHGKVTNSFLRVRFTIDPKGQVSLVQTDYRVPVGETERTCVSNAFKQLKFPTPEGNGSVVGVYNAPTR